jgi:nucleoside-diphosphate-sugar epimerase
MPGAGGTTPSADPRRVLVVGCGYVGAALAGMLVAERRDVWGIRRHPRGLPHGVRPIAADVNDPSTLTVLPDRLDTIVYAVSPAERTPAAYRRAYVEGLRNVLSAVANGHGGFSGRLLLISSTGVYGARDGRWVEEESSPEPADETAEAVLEGETLAVRSGARGVVLRLGGIYGPGRDRTVRRVLSGEAECPESGRFANRIHRDDAAAAARHLLLLPDPAPLYLGVDRDPADLRTVYAWIADRLGVPDPCAGVPEGSAAPPVGRRGTNKRCSSARLERSGFVFRYPTFREGYATLIPADLGATGGRTPRDPGPGSTPRSERTSQ